MKHYTDTELTHILEEIKAGRPFVGVRGDSMVGGVIAIHSQLNNWINYDRHGASTVKANIERLRWVIETIWEDADEIVPAIYSEYHIDFVPEDEKYKRIDYSTKHPNIFGK